MKMGKKILASIASAVMLFSMLTSAFAAETVTITGTTKDGEVSELFTIDGVLGKLEEGYKVPGVPDNDTYVCTSDFVVTFLEATETKYTTIYALEWKEAKHDPATFTFIEEGYNTVKSYKPENGMFVLPTEDYKVFRVCAYGKNSSLHVNAIITIDDNYVGETTEEPKEEAPVVETPAEEPERIAARYTNSSVWVDGKEVAFEAYNINNNNYFKLRDIAKVVSGSEKQFNVLWNGEQKKIVLAKNVTYEEVGGELVPGDGTDKTGIKCASEILDNDGNVIDALAAYTINNNNYFKLRDLGAWFDFDVTWDGENKRIIVDTTKSYTED